MWAVGIMYLMIGSVPIFVKHLNGIIKPSVLPIYKNMTRCGLGILLLSLIALFVKEPFDKIIPVIPVMFLALWMLKFTNPLFKATL